MVVRRSFALTWTHVHSLPLMFNIPRSVVATTMQSVNASSMHYAVSTRPPLEPTDPVLRVSSSVDSFGPDGSASSQHIHMSKVQPAYLATSATVTRESLLRNQIKRKLQTQREILSQLAAEYQVSDQPSESATETPASSADCLLTENESFRHPILSENNHPAAVSSGRQIAQLNSVLGLTTRGSTSISAQLPFLSPTRVSVQLSNKSALAGSSSPIRASAYGKPILSDNSPDRNTQSQRSVVAPQLPLETVLPNVWYITSETLVQQMDLLLNSCKTLTADILNDLDQTENELIEIGGKIGRVVGAMHELVHCEMASTQAAFSVSQHIQGTVEQWDIALPTSQHYHYDRGD